jgi:hypothetical protein
MSRTITTFGLLQAITAVVAIAVLFWSVGLPSLRFAQAANVTEFSDTLSDSAPGVAANHTIYFETPTGVLNGEAITLDFSDGPFTGTSSITATDIDVLVGTTSLTVAADCLGTEDVGASFTGYVLTLTFCVGEDGVIAANGSTTILIGTNATGGVNQLVNPGLGTWAIGLTAGADVGETRIFIVAPVLVTAAVDTIFTFSVDGVNATGTVNQSPITATSSTSTLPFGKLDNTASSTVAQQLSVSTNAALGFAVTVQVDQQLNSGSATIGGFINGTYTNTPTTWISPGGSISNPDSWGHWGITTDDATVAETDIFDVATSGRRYVSASTTPVTVFAHTGPADGSTQNIGTARVGYTAEVSALQPAGDYTATLTYVATPVF